MENPYLSSPGDGENLFNATTMHDTQSWGWFDIIAPGPSFQFNSSLNEFMSPIFKDQDIQDSMTEESAFMHLLRCNYLELPGVRGVAEVALLNMIFSPNVLPSLTPFFSSVKILQYYNERHVAYSMAAQTDDYCNKTLPLTVSTSQVLAVQPFFYSSIWFVRGRCMCRYMPFLQ